MACKGNFTLVRTNIYPTCFLPGPAPGPEDAVGHRQQGRGSSGEPAASHTKTFGLQGCAVCGSRASLQCVFLSYGCDTWCGVPAVVGEGRGVGEGIGGCVSQLEK